MEEAGPKRYFTNAMEDAPEAGGACVVIATRNQQKNPVHRSYTRPPASSHHPMADDDDPPHLRRRSVSMVALPLRTPCAHIASELREANFEDAQKIARLCKELTELSSQRSAGKVTVIAQSETIIYKAAIPPGSKYRYLSNFARRDFAVKVSNKHLEVDGTFSCVEALYQALKFNRPEQFANGGRLDGMECVKMLDGIKPGIEEKFLKKALEGPADGFIALSVSQLWGEKLQALKDQAPEQLRDFDRARPAAFAQIDSALCLLACQLLMLSQSAPARELLLETGSKPLEEYSDRPEGEFWSRYRPEEHGRAGPPAGSNSDGQNKMHLRELLRVSGHQYAERCGAKLLDELGPVLKGKEVLSSHAFAFYEDDSMTYAALLERVVPLRDPKLVMARIANVIKKEEGRATQTALKVQRSYQGRSIPKDPLAAAQASKEGDATMLKAMLGKGYVGVDDRVKCVRNNPFSLPFLNLAALHGQAPQVKMLLNEKACPNAPDSRRCSAAYVACQEGHADVLRVLAAFDGEPLGTRWRLVREQPELRTEFVNEKLSQALEEKLKLTRWMCVGAEKPAKGDEISASNEALIKALSDGHFEFKKEDLEQMQLKDLAAESFIKVGDLYFVHTVDLVVFDRMDPTRIFKIQEGELTAFSFIKVGDKYFEHVARQVDFNLSRSDSRSRMCGFTPMHIACQRGSLDCLEILIEQGAEVNCTSANGSTPAHAACRNNHIDCLKVRGTIAAHERLACLHPSDLYRFAGTLDLWWHT